MTFIKKLIAGAIASGLAAAQPPRSAAELIIPAFEYRTGAYAPNGIPFWNGFSDYLTLLNERDGGIGGVKIKIAPCETSYDNKLGVECYEKTKQGALVVNPVSTGISYALIPKAPVDKIPLLTSCLWPHLGRERPDLPLGLQLPGQLLVGCLRHRQIYRREGRRHGQAQGQEDRPCLFE